MNSPVGTNKPRVFVIHGRNDGVRDRIELILQRIGAEPMTLRKLPKQGAQTLIEVLEQNLPQADAVVVLMTPDDEGRLKDSNEPLIARARENVVAEAGYALIAKRERSLITSLGGVSVPSDFGGIHRIDAERMNERVQMQLAKRLFDMGLRINLEGAA
jgi:predicted nucleotide-binding protein